MKSKKVFLHILMIMFVLGVYSYSFGADYVTASINGAPGATGTWTTAISPALKTRSGFLNISVSGTWVANVYLQRSFDGSTWLDVNKTAWTVNCQHALIDKEHGVQYRLGVKNGGYTSGTVVLRLSRERR